MKGMLRKALFTVLSISLIGQTLVGMDKTNGIDVGDAWPSMVWAYEKATDRGTYASLYDNAVTFFTPWFNSAVEGTTRSYSSAKDTASGWYNRAADKVSSLRKEDYLKDPYVVGGGIALGAAVIGALGYYTYQWLKTPTVKPAFPVKSENKSDGNAPSATPTVVPAPVTSASASNSAVPAAPVAQRVRPDTTGQRRRGDVIREAAAAAKQAEQAKKQEDLVSAVPSSTVTPAPVAAPVVAPVVAANKSDIVQVRVATKFDKNSWCITPVTGGQFEDGSSHKVIPVGNYKQGDMLRYNLTTGKIVG